jgi:DNA-binding HxlR family transcriptional regulator
MGDELSPARLGVRYRVTPYGRTLQPVFETLWRWGTGHLHRPGMSHGTAIKPPLSA